jgi:hypothetical protein
MQFMAAIALIGITDRWRSANSATVSWLSLMQHHVAPTRHNQDVGGIT